MNPWDAICRISLAAEELSRCEYIDAQGANILRDACQSISATIDAHVLQRMRELLAAPQECARLHMDVPKVPEAGAGFFGTDAKGLQSSTVHAVSRN